MKEDGAGLTRRGRILVALSIFALILALPAFGGYLYLRSLGLYGSSSLGAPVEVVIPEGARATDIGRILEDEGVIKSALGFRLAVYMEGGAENIQAGRYEIPAGLTARDALAWLLGEGPGGVEFTTVTFPEGSWVTEFADRVGKDTHVSRRAFLDLVTSGGVRSEYQPDDVDTLEGLLFPSTYQVIEEDTAETIALRLVAEFDARADELGLRRAARQLGLTPYEAVIVASMIEAETRVDDERAKVARVIYNRIDAGWTLGIDATVLYALGDRRAELTRSALDTDSPYNTRKHAGLPPTPIGAPGVASLEAALEPADGDWMYYVLADCDGRHAFSATEADFQRDKAAFQQLDC